MKQLNGRAAISPLILLLFLAVAGCRKDSPPETGKPVKLSVVATIFPVYDFARTICGDRGDVTMLLPPGTEPHSYDPRPSDIAAIGKADIFIHTLAALEPWVPRLLQGIGKPSLVIVEAGGGAALTSSGPGGGDAGGGDHGTQGGIDPHVWLDLRNAALMVDAIADAVARKDPANGAYYRANADRLKGSLRSLDHDFSRGLSSCASRTIVHGGHSTFGYLAKRYGLSYVAAQAVNPDAEPTPATMARLIDLVRKEKISAVFSEVLLPPRIAETIAREARVRILPLHGAHTIGKDDFATGVTFIQIMRRNLENLKTGLECTPERPTPAR